MSKEILDLIHREAERVVRRHAPGCRFGIVSQYNQPGHQVRVSFPDDLDENGNPTLSPWMPIVAPAGSADAGDVAAPLMGSQAMVMHFGCGADRFTFMLGTVRASQDVVPSMPGAEANSGIPEGDRAIVHPTGGQGIYMPAAGTILAGAGAGTFKRLATEDFVLSVFNNHTHQYIPGSGSVTQTQKPQTQVASGDTTNMTAQLKGT